MTILCKGQNILAPYQYVEKGGADGAAPEEGEHIARRRRACSLSRVRVNRVIMNEARLSHLPFWGPSEAGLILIKRPSG